MTQPSLLIIEAAHVFDAEAASLVGVFARYGYRWKVLSNDPTWANPAWPTAISIEAAIRELSPTLVHFALHGIEEGLVLRLSELGETEDILTWGEIEQSAAWEGRVVISGACGMQRHSSAFLAAGASAVVAPRTTIRWENLCHFFRLFYSHLLQGEAISRALLATKNYSDGFYGEYDSIDVVGKELWSPSVCHSKELPNSSGPADG